MRERERSKRSETISNEFFVCQSEREEGKARKDHRERKKEWITRGEAHEGDRESEMREAEAAL